jgi:hypothetical protein
MLKLNNMTEEEQIEYIKECYWNIGYIENPSEILCLAAVKSYGTAIKYIKNPTEEICLEAAKKDGYAIQYINNPTEEICFAAIKQYGEAIQWIKNPTIEMVKLAIDKGCKLWDDFYNQDVICWSSEVQEYIKQCSEVEDILC